MTKFLLVIIGLAHVGSIACASVIGESELQATIEAAVETAVATVDTPIPLPTSTPDTNLYTRTDLDNAVAAAILELRRNETPTPTPPARTATRTPIPPTKIPTPTPKPIKPTPSPAANTATPVPIVLNTSVRPDNLVELRQFMLDMINKERVNRGIPPVLLGDNEAAQAHAEDMMNIGFLSHWNTKGEKPFIRFHQAGGFNYSAENASAVSYYVEPCQTVFCVRDPFELLSETMDGLMDSAGHRDNILDPWHTHVNLGIAYNGRIDSVSQQFENRYVKRYFEPPRFDKNGILIFAGELVEGWNFRSVRLNYDPPLANLTKGQLATTYCSMSGYPLAAFRRPPGRNAFYSGDTTITKYAICTDPYKVDPGRTAPRKGFPKDANRTISYTDVLIPWITADTWIVGGEDFEMRADVSHLLRVNGPGIYSVLIWAENKDDQAVIISEYPIIYYGN